MCAEKSFAEAEMWNEVILWQEVLRNQCPTHEHKKSQNTVIHSL